MSVDAELPDNPRKLYGCELRRLRKSAGVSPEDVSEAGHCTPSLLFMIERGERRPSTDFTRAVDPLVGAEGLLLRIHRLIEQEAMGSPSWFKGYLNAERSAKRLRFFDVQALPGLMQTEAYARALFEAARPLDVARMPIEDRIADRMARREILTRSDPPQVWVVVTEAAVRGVSGLRPDNAREQIAHLIDVAHLPNCVIQILAVGVHACMNGSFVLLTTPHRGESAYVETMDRGSLLHRESEVHEYERRYDLVKSVSLSPAESLKWLNELLMEYQS
ncbi:helix-turn-helix domain-containing protein [Embleya sp. MST-111070]|uniref:helix-turn-helix domain-containing protein n=1 Tax=Embleya sp. MST-111070 TaxID=3398231 RepID=UPI003F738F54